MKCTHPDSENSHNCFAPNVGFLTPCKSCPNTIDAQKHINSYKRTLRLTPIYLGQKLPKSFEEIENKRKNEN
ncbi:MAG: hypothetical protein M0R17_02915 [Candidatus Omnitrophica bacterium]|jgi:hypothetical protein|nr:hypothetical protein [Candidatus Omnitrophota bacterium]